MYYKYKAFVFLNRTYYHALPYSAAQLEKRHPCSPPQRFDHKHYANFEKNCVGIVLRPVTWPEWQGMDSVQLQGVCSQPAEKSVRPKQPRIYANVSLRPVMSRTGLLRGREPYPQHLAFELSSFFKLSMRS